MTYRIRNWEKNFEVHETHRVKHMRWVPVPIAHDGKNYRRIIAQKCADMRNIGATVYGAWVLMLEVAAKCEDCRGTLADEDGPLTADDLAFKTGAAKEDFEIAIPILLNVGWLEELDDNGKVAQKCAEVRRSAQKCAEVRRSAQKCAEVRNNAQKCGSIRQGSTLHDKEGKDKEGNDKEKHPAQTAAPEAVMVSPAEQFVKAWYALPAPFPKIAAWTKKRATAFKERMKDPHFRENWSTGLERMKASVFCRGENDRGWIADVEFFLRPDTLAKILEGKYDGNGKRPAKAPSGPSPAELATMKKILEENKRHATQQNAVRNGNNVSQPTKISEVLSLQPMVSSGEPCPPI